MNRIRRILLSAFALPFYGLGWSVGKVIKLCRWIRDAFRAGYVRANASFIGPTAAEFETEPLTHNKAIRTWDEL